jgi:multimeric flavodoxin WrbA
LSKLKAVHLVGTLKPSPEISNTYTLSEFLARHLDSHGVENDIVRLIDYNIKPGTHTHVNNNSSDDDWPAILEKILASPIIIFATPVWWGNQSSLIQRAIERLDEIHDEIMNTGRSRMTNKVAGIVVTGDSDGAEHIIGNLANFFISLGFTIPAASTLTVLWPGQSKGSNKSREELWKYYEKTYTSMAKGAAQNLAFMANLLKQNPLPDSLRP